MSLIPFAPFILHPSSSPFVGGEEGETKEVTMAIFFSFWKTSNAVCFERVPTPRHGRWTYQCSGHAKSGQAVHTLPAGYIA